MAVLFPVLKKGLSKPLTSLFLLAGLTASTFAQSGGNADEKSSFKANLYNLEAAANETFRFNTTLKNAGKEARSYALSAKLPAGWFVTFRTMGSQVTSVLLEPGKTQDISVEINASAQSKPDKYPIPVTAVSLSDTLKLDLEAVLKGSYSIEFTTPTGRLSTEVTEGSVEDVLCTVRNTGTLPLENVELNAQTPPSWQVTFEPSKIDRIDPSGKVDVRATFKVPSKTIAGDYVSTLTARSNNASSSATFRVTVKTSILSGWLGILVILIAAGVIYRLINKYGRR